MSTYYPKEISLTKRIFLMLGQHDTRQIEIIDSLPSLPVIHSFQHATKS